MTAGEPSKWHMARNGHKYASASIGTSSFIQTVRLYTASKGGLPSEPPPHPLDGKVDAQVISPAPLWRCHVGLASCGI